MKRARICGELKRWFEHVNDEPAMCIAPTVYRAKKIAYVICLSAAWKYREPPYMMRQCGVIIDLFELGFSSQRMAKIAAMIEDGLDELVHMAPPEKDAPKVIGEGDLWVGSSKMGFEITDAQLRRMAN